MPGKSAQVKNEKQYEALKDKGMSKERAAKIANSPTPRSTAARNRILPRHGATRHRVARTHRKSPQAARAARRAQRKTTKRKDRPLI